MKDPYEAQCQWENCSGGRFCEKHSLEIDPYLAQGRNFRVHHPVQPKTQVEKWGEEKEANIKVIVEHCGMWFAYRCTEHKKNFEKVGELEELIAEEHTNACGFGEGKICTKDHRAENKVFLNRNATGEFADDIENAPEYIKKSLFGYNFKKITLLDKIKKLLQ